MATKNTFKENVLRVIAVVGLIAVLLLGAWGIIQLAFFLPTFFSNIATGTPAPSAKETLTVALPMAVTSGQTIPLSWTHKGFSGQYSYAISYSCVEGLTIKTVLPTGASQEVACNTPFNYVNASTTTPLTPVLTGTKLANVAVTVTATKLSTGAVTATASSGTTVSPAAKPAAQPAAKPSSSSTTKYVPSGRTTNLYGYPDLAVRITNHPTTAQNGQRISMQFVIENVGTNVVPQNWNFIATLPYVPAYTYQSAGQQALYPGDKIVYTLGYNAQSQTTATNPCAGWTYCDSPAPVYGGQGTCNQYGPCIVSGYSANIYGYTYPQTTSVVVDSFNQVWENSESNNTAAITFTVY